MIRRALLNLSILLMAWAFGALCAVGWASWKVLKEMDYY